MIRQILVPLDGSAVAETILPEVVAFAKLNAASVRLLQVIEPLETMVGLTGEQFPTIDVEIEASLESDAHAYLNRVAQRLQAEGIAAQTRVELGSPSEIILQVAREFDLVAMATHGRSGIGRWVYGSVADKVLRGATVPVLLIRARPEEAPPPPTMQRLLVPLDGSELAEHALPLAIAIATKAPAHLILFRSINWAQDFIGASAYIDGAGGARLIELAEEGAREYMGEVSQRLRDQGLTVATEIRLDPPADGILTCAEESGADLIVMSTHGRGGLGRWVYGSVADRVLRGATVPVLLVRSGVAVDEMPVPSANTTTA